MANYVGALAHRDFIGDGPATELNGAFGVATATVNGKTYVYASGASDNGLQIMTLDGEGNLTEYQAIPDTLSQGLANPKTVSTHAVGDELYLFVSASNDTSLTAYRINQTAGADEGKLTLVDFEQDAVNLTTTEHHKVATVGAKTFIVSTGNSTLTVHQFLADGTLVQTDVEKESLTPALPLATNIELTTIKQGNLTYVVTGSMASDGVGLWRLNGQGQLIHIETEGASSAMRFRTIHAATVADKQFVFASSLDDHKVITYELVNGLLVERAVYDGNGDSNNYVMVGLHSVVIEGMTFLVGQSAGNHSTGLYRVNDDGSIARIQLATSGASQLGAANAGTEVTIDGRVFMLTTAQLGGGYVNVLEVGGGNDTLTGGAENDRMAGLFGNDFINGAAGNDVLIGGLGDDELYGGTGADTLDGGDGDDVLRGGNFDNTDTGNNTLNGGDGDDELQGGSKNDTLDGGVGIDVLSGNGGNDLLIAGEGADAMLGGDGFDIVTYAGADTGIEVGLAGNSAFGNYAEGDTFTGIEGLVGSALNDTLSGTPSTTACRAARDRIPSLVTAATTPFLETSANRAMRCQTIYRAIRLAAAMATTRSGVRRVMT